jgi:hypothetical protein
MILNVMAITTLTSLTLIWYLRRLDRQTLARRMSRGPQSVALVHAESLAVASLPEEDSSVKESVVKESITKQSLPEPTGAAPERRLTLPATSPNIHPLASRRSQDWTAPSVAQWSQRVSGNSQPAPPSNSRVEQKELPVSQRIVFPQQSPKPAAVQHLAGPIELCRSMAAAKYGRSSC